MRSLFAIVLLVCQFAVLLVANGTTLCLKHLERKPAILVEVGDLILFEDQTVTWKGMPVLDVHRSKNQLQTSARFSDRAWRILLTLADEADTVISYDILMETVWYESPERKDFSRLQNLRVQLGHIRNSFKQVDQNFDQLENVEGSGYLWRSAHKSISELGGIEISHLSSRQKGIVKFLSGRPMVRLNATQIYFGNYKIKKSPERYENAVDLQISRIRRVLKSNHPGFDKIKGSRKSGYYWEP